MSVATEGRGGVRQPLTFGHPFPKGVLQPSQALQARVGEGALVPVQVDRIARHKDGSVRFAIFSLILPELSIGQPVPLALERAPGPTGAAILTLSASSIPEITIEVQTYASRLIELKFGNRVGHAAGTAFEAGERISLLIGEAPTERYTLEITPDLAGGNHVNLTKIAAAFAKMLEKSPRFAAIHLWSSYERLGVIERRFTGQPFGVRFEYGGRAPIEHRIVREAAPRRSYIVDGRAALLDRTAPDRLGGPWLKGPVAVETHALRPFRAVAGGERHPLLAATIAFRAHQGGERALLEVGVENAWAFADGPSNVTYDVSVRIAGREAFVQKGMEHYHHARWRKQFWLGAAPDLVLAHDKSVLLASGAMHHYDPTLKISPAAIDSDHRRLTSANTGPMGIAFVTPYMPQTGGRPDIGPLPAWSVRHLLSQDPRAKAVALANGDAAATLPMHYRDEATLRPLDLFKVTGQSSQHKAFYDSGKLPEVKESSTPFFIDHAHQPSLSYYPYLLTGDYFHLEELHFWANWNMLFPYDAKDRERKVVTGQLRGQAWTLRTLAHAAFITPDDHPQKAYFAGRLAVNVKWQVQTFALDPKRQGELAGRWLPPESGGRIAPWQHDFMTLTYAYLAENDEPGAADMLRWLSAFTLGRWLAEEKGYCRALAPAYWIKVRHPDSNREVANWRELAAINFPSAANCGTTAWVDASAACSYCYTSIGRAALAVFKDAGYERAAGVIDYLARNTANGRADFHVDPTFAIVPRRK